LCKKQGIFDSIQYYKENIKNEGLSGLKIGWFEPLDPKDNLWYHF
jgi:hypothetical protein